ncbi:MULTISPECIES: hypothetical protein [Pseudoxanthomonas]|uniref:Uncharacterized protein n=1 Tax=Pseudoxanthomonas winnipegensis TaxID=2480810 RepID=A0AAW8G9P1_9GAMM|nr:MULTISPECIES: hypothetical protein [Pseudoxanthomonas]MDQ1118903.1 hypothetical protein [Pseudoxanthomonas winnipegensis]MDQ1132091.1 hypothetical protein [Pseudoxanthomonas winnipegensis]MDR6137896.1 hypothetical protein [Pseudoxanthomonas sp. SORGH_AS_0997]
MDVTKASLITIEFEAFYDLLAKKTANPISEEEVPEMLRTAIQSGTKVLLTDVHGGDSLELKICADGKFVYEPRP